MSGNLIMSSCKIGINTSNPQSLLHIGKNTTTVPQLQFEGGGELCEVPISGSIQFTKGRFYITGANQRVISRASNTMTSSIVVSNTSAQHCLFSSQITANTLLVGKMHRILGYGSLSTHDASDKVTITTTMNGTTLVTLETTAGLVTDAPWNIETVVTTREEGINGVAAGFGHIQFTDKHLDVNVYSAHINTIAVNAFGIQAKWDTANVGNSIRLDQAILKVDC